MTRESISKILFGYREKFLRTVDKGEVKIFQSIALPGPVGGRGGDASYVGEHRRDDSE